MMDMSIVIPYMIVISVLVWACLMIAFYTLKRYKTSKTVKIERAKVSESEPSPSPSLPPEPKITQKEFSEQNNYSEKIIMVKAKNLDQYLSIMKLLTTSGHDIFVMSPKIFRGKIKKMEVM